MTFTQVPLSSLSISAPQPLRFDEWVIDFAAKSGAKEKNCTPGKSYPCKSICLGVKKNCREPLEGQAKTYSDWLKIQGEKVATTSPKKSKTKPPADTAKTATKSATKKVIDTKPSKTKGQKTDLKTDNSPIFTPAPSKISRSALQPTFLDSGQAAKQYKVLGSGIEGTVYLDKGPPKRALKYFQRGNLNPKELDGVRIAGELGIGPKILETGQANSEVKDKKHAVMSIEFLDGFSVGIHPPGDNNTKDYDKSFLNKIKIAHDNDYIPSDLHEDNVMVNPTTKDVKLIDQGGLAKGSWQDKAIQLLDKYSPRPMVTETARRYLADSKDKKALREFEKLQKKVSFRDDEPINDPDYEKIVKQAYKLLKL